MYVYCLNKSHVNQYKKIHILHIISDIILYSVILNYLISYLISIFLCIKYPVINKIYSDSIDFMNNYMINLLLICILFKLDKFSKKDAILSIIIIIICKLSSSYGCNNDLYIVSLLIVACYKTDFYTLMSFITFIRFIIVTITILFAIWGLVENFVVTGKRTRYFLGFIWTTFPAIHFLFISLSIIILKNKINILDYFVLLFINIWLYNQTKTRYTFLISMTSLLFFIIMGKVIKKITEFKPIKIFLLVFPFICAIFIFILTVSYKNNTDFINKLDILISGRLKLGYNALKNYGITLFGSKIQWKGSVSYDLHPEDYNFVDSSYLNILFSYGIIPLITVLLIFSSIMYKAIKNKRYNIAWVLFFTLLFAITEPELIWIHFCPFILLFFSDLKDDRKKDNNML